MKYNDQLFGSLARELGVKRYEIGEAVGGSRMWYTHAVNAGDVMIKHLVKLCNRFHIDIRHFLVDESSSIRPVLISKDWQDIEYHPDVIQCLWKNHHDRIVMRKQVQEDTGWDKLSLSAFMREDGPMKIKDWVQLVNLYDLDPMMIFEDKNEWINNKTAHEKDKEIESLRRQLLKARLETTTLRSRMAHEENMRNMVK